MWVVQIRRILQRRPGTCTYCCAGILSDEIDAEASDNGASVVLVQAIKGEAVVEQGCGLMEHLTSHLDVHLGSRLGYCLCGCQELIERWVNVAVGHSANFSERLRPRK